MPHASHKKITLRLVAPLAGAVLLVASAATQAAMSDNDAKKLLKDNDCTKCHAIDKTKKGPSYEKVAAKYKGKPDAVEKLNHNLTDAPKVKLEDGTEEDHKVLKTDNPQQKADLINWILAR